jgi:adenine phosphoribosyltransferase
MLEKLHESLLSAPIVRRGDYNYFIHPISDGVPFLEPELLEEITTHITEIADMDIDRILTIEAMGIPLATSLSMRTGIPFSIIRKRQYALDGEIVISQKTGYSKGEMYVNAVKRGDKVLIVDDVISTGGTLLALMSALRDAGVEISDVIVVIERGEGASRLRDMGFKVKTLVRISVNKDRVSIEA